MTAVPAAEKSVVKTEFVAQVDLSDDEDTGLGEVDMGITEALPEVADLLAVNSKAEIPAGTEYVKCPLEKRIDSALPAPTPSRKTVMRKERRDKSKQKRVVEGFRVVPPSSLA